MNLIFIRDFIFSKKKHSKIIDKIILIHRSVKVASNKKQSLRYKMIYYFISYKISI